MKPVMMSSVQTRGLRELYNLQSFFTITDLSTTIMSEQTEIKSCCVTGRESWRDTLPRSGDLAHSADIHEGQPLGKIEIVHGLRTYISNSKTDGEAKQDGVSLPSSRLSQL